MGAEQNRSIAQQLLTSLGQGEFPESTAELFSPDLDFEIPGHIARFQMLEDSFAVSHVAKA